MRLAAALAIALCACSEPAAPPTPTYVLDDVVAKRVRALEAEVASEPVAPAGDPIDERSARAMLEAIEGGSGKLRRAALDELVALGDRAVPALRATIGATDDAAALRAVAAEALGEIATVAAVEALLDRLERARLAVDPEPWMRARAAWCVPIARADWARDRLILALKLETDYETVIWVARKLAEDGSLAGLAGLDAIARDAARPELASEAQAALAEIARGRGFDDPAALLGAHARGELFASEQRSPPSARARLAIWRRIAGLAEWQLRGVDDARFVLARLGPSAVEPLRESLRDRDRYVRVHAAQVLERMGPRARAATDALIAGLGEPMLAPQAARALGAIGADPAPGSIDADAASGSVGAEPARLALLSAIERGKPLELRVAAARALGAIGVGAHAGALEPLLAPGEPADLRAAAAIALLPPRALGAAQRELAVLAEILLADPADTGDLELAIERWLAAAGAPAESVHARWRAAAEGPGRARARGAIARELAAPPGG